jgi:hypothetical protein
MACLQEDFHSLIIKNGLAKEEVNNYLLSVVGSKILHATLSSISQKNLFKSCSMK